MQVFDYFDDEDAAMQVFDDIDYFDDEDALLLQCRFMIILTIRMLLMGHSDYDDDDAGQ